MQRLLDSDGITSPCLGRLRSFRLSEVPESVRLEAAVANAEAIARTLKHDRAGVVANEEERWAAMDAAVEAATFALNPPPTVHWVSQEAWDAMLVRAEKLDGGS